MPKQKLPNCAHCPLSREERIYLNAQGRAFKGCPSVNQARLIEEANQRYNSPEYSEFTRQASIQEAQGYGGREIEPFVLHPVKTRIEEIIEFAGKMKYRRLGLAFCVGLAREAAVAADLFESRGFEVVSVICKVGSVPKEQICLAHEQKIRIGKYEPMCNPISQAMILNQAGSEFNILLGLCVGHDSLFFKQADAPCTVLAVKDRVTGHNPLAAVYLIESYYARLKKTERIVKQKRPGAGKRKK